MQNIFKLLKEKMSSLNNTTLSPGFLGQQLSNMQRLNFDVIGSI